MYIEHEELKQSHLKLWFTTELREMQEINPGRDIW